MPANQAVPYFRPGQDITGVVTGSDVLGKRLVSWAAGGSAIQPNIATAAAGARVAGVTGHDQVVGGIVNVSSAGVYPVAAGGDITAGSPVEAGADGKVVTHTTGTSTGVVVGTAVADAADGTDAAIHLSL